jgi:predicted ATPase
MSNFDEASSLVSRQDSDFIGRRGDISELRVALEDAVSGRQRIIMLVGEPGIGKTRISQELAAMAERQGAQVLWGRCYEQTGMPSYWPWMQVIRSYIQGNTIEQLYTEIGLGIADLAELVPEIKAKLPNLEPEQARFRLFDSVPPS